MFQPIIFRGVVKVKAAPFLSPFREAGSLSALAVGHALLLHLELATVPLLAAAVSACCNETKVGGRPDIGAIRGALFFEWIYPPEV